MTSRGHSCLYRGTVKHARYAPAAHAFDYNLFMLYIDLDELPCALGPWPLAASDRPALVSLWQRDYLGGQAPTSLAQGVRNEIERRTGRRPSGPVRLLAHPRYAGYVLNPLAVFYVFKADGKTLEYVLGEVSNVPWGEKHLYLMAAEGGEDLGKDAARRHKFRTPKEFHVSPFMPMTQEYEWTVTPPGERLFVGIQSREAGKIVFTANLDFKRQPLSAWHLTRLLGRFPMVTAQVWAGIHWQALRLWLKRVPVHDHPGGKRLGQGEVVSYEERHGDV